MPADGGADASHLVNIPTDRGRLLAYTGPWPWGWSEEGGGGGGDGRQEDDYYRT